MIITREKLLDLALREAKRQARADDVISGYVIGSVAGGEPLLGGTADVDLVLIHSGLPSVEHQILQLSDDVHLDVTHHDSKLYGDPKSLRLHPWLGPSMCEPVFLFDPEHYFEWAQAGVRGQFHRPDNVHARALGFLSKAREMKAELGNGSEWAGVYARSVLEGANAAASLAGFPAAGRRLVIVLEQRAESLERRDVYEGFLGLLGGALTEWNLPEWLSAWGRTYDAAAKASFDPEMDACRLRYYLNGFQALAEMGRPEAVVWTLLTTWEKALQSLAALGQASELLEPWIRFLQALELSPEHRPRREGELEQYLDAVELLVESWAEGNGAWTR